MKHIQPLRIFAKRLILLVAGLSILSVAKPQTAPLSLKQALQYALKNKSEAAKSRLDVENSRNKIDEAKAQALPHINGSGSLTYNPILQLSALPAESVGSMPRSGSAATTPHAAATITVIKNISRKVSSRRIRTSGRAS